MKRTQKTKQSKQPALSISLLSSGRKKTIRKCLDSLKPLMEQLDCELIIVDTGCDEETHALLLEYTSQVIPFTWCDDFSKARNAGLEQAKGEWFLYLDDDEWFIDVDAILAFFQSGEYRQYGQALYIQRNYQDYDETFYTDSWVSRMIRLDEDTHFESSIHEYLFPVKGEHKLLRSIVKHFGYIFDTEEEKYAHSKRNVRLLQNMFQKEKDNPRWGIQLAQEYRNIGEFYMLEEVCREGLELLQDKDDAYGNRHRGTFYVGLVEVAMRRSYYDEAVKLYKQALADTRNTSVCQAKLHGMGAEIYYKIEEYAASEECCCKYIELYEKLNRDEDNFVKESSFFIEDVFENSMRNNVYCFYIGDRLKRGDASVLQDYFWQLGWEDQNLSLYTAIVADILDAMAREPFAEVYVEAANTLMKRRGVDDKVVEVLMRKEADEAAFAQLCRIFSQVESTHYYIWYMKLLHADRESDKVRLSECMRELFARVENPLQLPENVFDIVIRRELDIEPYITKLPFDRWKASVNLFCGQASPEKLEKYKAMPQKLRKRADVRWDYFELKLCEAEAVGSAQTEDLAALDGILSQFVERSRQLYGRYYKQKAFTGEMELLPAACRLAVRLEPVLEAGAKRDLPGLRESLTRCYGVYAPMEETLTCYGKLYAARIEEQLAQERQNAREMQELAAQIKERIRLLTEQSRHADALLVCEQLRDLLPEDEEAAQMERQLREELE